MLQNNSQPLRKSLLIKALAKDIKKQSFYTFATNFTPNEK